MNLVRLFCLQGHVLELIIEEHNRVINNPDKSACDVKVICKDGYIFYTKILLYFMQPSLKCILEDQSNDNELIVIIHPSVLVEDIKKFYEAKSPIISTPPLTQEDLTQDATDSNILKQLEVPVQLNEEIMFCEKCGIGYKSLKQLKAHQWRMHPSKSPLKNFKCDECDKEFIHKCELTKHMFIHMPPSFVCNTCDKVFKRRKGLVAHHNTVHGTSAIVLQCPECPETFKVKTNLSRHVANVHKGIKYTCVQCNASFNRQDNYKRHLKLHK